MRLRPWVPVMALVALTGCAGSSAGGASDAQGTRPAPPSVRTPAAQATGEHSVRPAAPAATPSPTPTRQHFNYVYPVKRCSSSPSASHHDYPASDIFTQRGCRFVATTRGRVDEVSRRDRWDPSVDSGGSRGGRYVSIVGDDGVRYYGSHLLRVAKGIKPGVRVRAGQLLGLIDNSGDARYTPTHVHYGISWPTRPHIWWVRRGEVWPQRFLSAWRNGEDRSPAHAVRRKHRQMGTVPKCQVEC